MSSFLHTSSLSQNEEGKLTSFLARACSAPSSMPNDLKYKAIVAGKYGGVQVETDCHFTNLKFYIATYVMACAYLDIFITWYAKKQQR